MSDSRGEVGSSQPVAERILPPLPEPDEDSREFWDGCRRHELRMQRCAQCKRFRFYPRPMCPSCLSMQDEWVRVSGRGTLYSWIVCHPPVLPALRARVPLAVLLVELAEDPGLRMVGNLHGGEIEDLRIGLPLEVCFEDVLPDVSLPQWRPASRDG